MTYLHAYIPPQDASILATLSAPSIFLRVFTAPVEITRNHYAQYLEFLGHPEHLTDFHDLGAVRDAAGIRAHLLAQQEGKEVDGIAYDIVLEDQQDYERYLTFARQTVKLEAERPVFAFSKTTSSTTEPYRNVRVLPEGEGLDTVPNHEEPTLVLQLPAPAEPIHHVLAPWARGKPTMGSNIHCGRLMSAPNRSPILSAWSDIVKKYSTTQTVVHFYCHIATSDVAADLPRIMVRVGNAWEVCDLTDIEKQLRVKGLFTCRLSTGHMLYDAEDVWQQVLGKEAMPAVSIEESLELLGSKLTFKKGKKDDKDKMLVATLSSEQTGAVMNILKNPALRPFCLESLYGLFGKPPAGLPPSSMKMRLLGATAKPTVIPEAVDTFASPWATFSQKPTPSPSYQDLHRMAVKLLADFKAWVPPPPPSSTSREEPPSPTLFFIAFKLFVAKRAQEEKHEVTNHVDVLQYLDRCETPLDMGTLEPHHAAHLCALLAPQAKILGDGEEMLEMKLLLSLYANPLARASNRQHMSQLFEIVVKKFAELTMARKEGLTVRSCTMWEAFISFLRQHRLDFVGFFGLQTTFNDILRDQGFEQKRLAAGKMWMNVALHQS